MIVLDGAMGTELTRRGIDTTLPLWSASAMLHAPDTVRAIHADYVAAGAQVLTCNTFRTNTRALAKAELAEQAEVLTRRAVQLAREAAVPGVHVAGSLAPVEDCYEPALVPHQDALVHEHAELARHLAGAGVDLILVETMNTVREAVAACSAVSAVKVPLWVSFTLAPDNTLLSGETLMQAVAAVLPYAPRAILLNCIPVAQTEAALAVLADALAGMSDTTRPRIGAYGNVGHVDPVVGWTLTDAVSPIAYAKAAMSWRERGASIIGGCCGTTPAHIAAITR
jgi:S-methylmethionine-dependent homocysteine/selenocysteine methylase